MIGIETRIGITQRQKKKKVVGLDAMKSLVGLTSCKTWMFLNYADSAKNQLTPGKQTAESPEGRKENQ